MNITRIFGKQKSLSDADLQKEIAELLWANIFHDTILDSEWFKKKTLSPGRWAVGYPFLYVLFRSLNATRPESILEIGLGESSKVTSQYAEWFNKKHLVVEHDSKWIDFFTGSYELQKNTDIIQLNLSKSNYKNIQNIRVYENFYNTLKENIFDFILIDGPLGADMPVMARIDVLSIFPNCLSDKFVILVDDYNRNGEKNMLIELENILNSSGRKYSKSVYAGKKDMVIVCSKHFDFLCSM